MSRARLGLATVVIAVLCGPAGSAQAASLYATQHALGANSVAQFKIGTGGRLEPFASPTIGANQRPLGIAVSPSGKSVYVSNAQSDDIAQYTVADSGQLTAKNPFLFGLPSPVTTGGREGIAVSPSNANVYSIAAKAPLAGLAQLGADGNGLLSALTPDFISAGTDPIDVAVHPTLPKVYATDQGNDQVRVFTADGKGLLSNAASPSATNAAALTITPDGRFLYATGSGSKSVYGFKVEPSGALVAIGGSPWEYTEGAAQGIVASNGNVYVSNLSGVALFDIDQVSGALALKSPDKVALSGAPAGIALAPDGASLYVASATGSKIFQFDVLAGGGLAAKVPPSVAVSGQPTQLAVSAIGTGASEGVGQQPEPPKQLPPPPPPPPKFVTEYVAYQYRKGEVLVMEVTKKDGKVDKIKFEVAKCYPPPEEKTKCAGLVEVRIRKNGFIAIDEDTRVNPTGKKVKKNAVLAKGRFSIPAGKSGKVVLKVTAEGRAALAGKKSLQGWLVTKLDNGPAGQISGQEKLTFKINDGKGKGPKSK